MIGHKFDIIDIGNSKAVFIIDIARSGPLAWFSDP
jgi:hypothetical protein